MSEPLPPSSRARHVAWPQFLFVASVLLGVLGFAVTPYAMGVLGLGEYRMWFLDSHAVLAAIDAVNAGLDPRLANPLDALGRPHVYSDWWLALGALGLTREDNFLLGAAWSAGFLVVAGLTLRPSSYRECGWYALFMLSPPVLFAIARGNNDLVIFALLGMAALALQCPTVLRCGIAAALIALATGLKYYPVAAVFAFLLVRPAPRMRTAVAVGGVLAGGALLAVWSSVARAQFPLPPSLYTLGAGIVFRDAGWAGRGPQLIGLGLLAVAAVALARARYTTGLADAANLGVRRSLFALGATVLLACFAAGTSYAYRWIFALWLVPWLLEQARASEAPAGRLAARVTLALLVLVFWGDGLLCTFVNLVLVPRGITAGEFVFLRWRWLTQPFVWGLMALLAGWLMDLMFSAWRACRSHDEPAIAGRLTASDSRSVR